MSISMPPPANRDLQSLTASPFTQDQLRDLVRELTAELGRISRRLELLADFDMEDAGRLDAADERAMLSTRHARFTDALERVAAERYGVCEGCRSIIPYGRLLLQPEAERCAPCTEPG